MIINISCHNLESIKAELPVNITKGNKKPHPKAGFWDLNKVKTICRVI